MKNKHLTFMLAVLMSMAVCSMTLVSCDDNEGEEPGSEIDEKDAVALDNNYSDGTLTYEIISEAGRVAQVKSCQKSIQRISIPSVLKKGSKVYAVTHIAIGAFEDSPQLKEVNIPEGIVSIGAWAFYGCSSLESLKLPNSLRSIGHDAFYECPITSITLPRNLTAIGSSAFGGTEIKTVYSYIKNPAQCAINSPQARDWYENFPSDEGLGIYEPTLVVPKGCLDQYKSTGNWKYFKEIKEGDFSAKDADYDDSKYDNRNTSEVFAQMKGYWEQEQIGENSYPYMEITDKYLYYRCEDGSIGEKYIINRFDKNTNTLECTYIDLDTGSWVFSWFIEVMTVSTNKMYIHYYDDEEPDQEEYESATLKRMG